MATVNRVFLIGNVGNSPQLYYVEGFMPMAKFSLATNTKPSSSTANENTAQWHNIILWNQLAEQGIKTIQKGDLVCVEGKMEYRIWQDKQGNTLRDVNIVADHFTLL